MKICQPKDKGGLGFKKFADINNAYMAKLAWQMVNNPEKLWVRIMKSKYSCGSYGMPIVSPKTSASATWKAIVKNWNMVERNLSWIIKDGNNTASGKMPGSQE